MYHNVEYSKERQSNWVSPERFQQHLGFLRKNHFNVITLKEFVDAKRNGRSLPARTTVLTFDDGYENNYTNAFPLLKQYGYPATIFMVSDFIGKEGFLSLAQIQEMMQYGITFQGHSLTHVYLPDLALAQQRREVIDSKEILEKSLGVKIDYFAYPIGGYNDTIKGLVKEAGYTAAFTTNRGTDRDIYELKRVRLSDGDSRSWDLWTKLLGYNYAFKSPKGPY